MRSCLSRIQIPILPRVEFCQMQCTEVPNQLTLFERNMMTVLATLEEPHSPCLWNLLLASSFHPACAFIQMDLFSQELWTPYLLAQWQSR